MHRLLVDGTRRPDEAWLLAETEFDLKSLLDAYSDLYELDLVPRSIAGTHIRHLPTPREDGRYAVIPYAHKINYALDRTAADLIVYLDNGSFPGPKKIEVMARALETHPEWGAVYCTQKRTGMHELVSVADLPVHDAYCNLNYTQVMHRRTPDRWPLSMEHANPDLADGIFWRSLHKTLGTFHPVGPEIHDEHHIPAPQAAGLTP